MTIDASPLLGILDRLHRELAGLTAGEVATYIPELGLADPGAFGIAVATLDGAVFSVGDAEQEFTIQSISKPLVFGLALEERGDETVLGRVGIEPSGNAFNSVAVDAETNRPFNPMVNAGAIVSTSLVSGERPDDDRRRVIEHLGRFAGRPLRFDEAVHRSERDTGDRNRAIAWLMSSFGMIDVDVEAAVDLYFAQCSVLVTCRDLALIGATLANEGVQPRAGERALAADHVTKVLSVMTTCGMYDSAGAWVYNVGLPAKSGVAGGVLAVLPGQLGIGVFSPPLDARGNSVRGIAACERLSEELDLHVLGQESGVHSVVRRVLRGEDLVSNRMRTVAEDDVLALARGCVALFELQGSLFFTTAERTHREIAGGLDGIEYVILDLTRITAIDAPALAVLDALADALVGSGRTLLAVSGHGDTVAAKLSAKVITFHDADAAVEWCEDRLLAARGAEVSAAAGHDFEHLDLLEGLDHADLAAVAAAAVVRVVPTGSRIFEAGDPATDLYFLLEGRVSVLLPLGEGPGAPVRRLATFGPGVAFGEMALLDDEVRSATVVCDEDSTVAALSLAALAGLDREHPEIRHHLQANLARLLARRLRAANAQVRALAR